MHLTNSLNFLTLLLIYQSQTIITSNFYNVFSLDTMMTSQFLSLPMNLVGVIIRIMPQGFIF